MRMIEEQIAALERVEAPQTKQPDFDAFWAETVAEARNRPLQVEGGPIDYPIPEVEVRDLTFEGVDGTKVHAWLLLPAASRRGGPVPVVCCFHGAGGSRGVPASHAAWLAMGAAVIAHDFRMQTGLTGSATGFAGGGVGTWFSWGVLDARGHFFRRAWGDCLRAVELALATPEIDDARIAVTGGSQGGAAALAIAALHPAVAGCMADVPSNCWLEKRLFDRAGGVAAVAQYLRANPDLVDRACRTLSYFDIVNLADRIRCPVKVSLGLKDPVCPPENVYAACNRITAPIEICPYPFGEHDGGGAAHLERKLAFFNKHFLDAAAAAGRT